MTSDNSAGVFQRVRYLPGVRNNGLIDGAIVCLTRANDRDIEQCIITLGELDALGYLGNDTARLMLWLLDNKHVESITVRSWRGVLVAILYLPDGESNPGLAFLNRINSFNGLGVLPATELIEEAGFPWNEAVYPDDRTPSGCRLVDTLEKLLLKAVNDALVAQIDEEPTEVIAR